MRAHAGADLQRTTATGDTSTKKITITQTTAQVNIEGRGDRATMMSWMQGTDGMRDVTMTTMLKARGIAWVARDGTATMTNAADASTRGEVKKETRGSDTKRRNAVIETNQPRKIRDGERNETAATMATGGFAIVK